MNKKNPDSIVYKAGRQPRRNGWIKVKQLNSSINKGSSTKYVHEWIKMMKIVWKFTKTLGGELGFAAL